MEIVEKDCFLDIDADSLGGSARTAKCHPSTQMWIWVSTMGLVFWMSISAGFAENIITVTASNGAIHKDKACSISEAIINANTDTDRYPECKPGKEDDIILLSGDNVTLSMDVDKTDGRNGTPSVTSTIILDGQGRSLTRDNALTCNLDSINNTGEFRLLHVGNTGHLTVRNISLGNGCADGTDFETHGGATFNRGTLTVSNSTFSDNQASLFGGGLYSYTSATVTKIENSTFYYNSSLYGGGGIYNQGTLTLFDNNTFTENSSFIGGGIYNIGTLTTLINSTIYENWAINGGGGIYNAATLATIANSTFSGNVAGDLFGGGIYNYSEIGTITNSTFSGNSAGDSGGGIYTRGTLTTIENSTFSGNSAEFGGGINNSGTLSSITDTTFSGNIAFSGGGLINRYGTLNTISNSTFSANSADLLGGGVYNFNATLNTIINSTFFGNSAGDTGGGIVTDESNIDSLKNSILAGSTNGNCSVGQSLVGSIGGIRNLTDDLSCPDDTYFDATKFDATLKDNGCLTPGPDRCVKTHALIAGSNAINKAVKGTANDQRGFASEGIRDIGAYEFISISGGCFPYTPNDKMLMICW